MMKLLEYNLHISILLWIQNNDRIFIKKHKDKATFLY